MKIRYTVPAATYLKNVLDHIGMQSQQGAKRLAARIKAIEKLLEQFPTAGAPTRLPWLRRLAVVPFPYLIFYEVMNTELVIHAIRHGARDPADMPDA